MGVVYLVEDTKLERKVALKFLPQQFTVDDDAKARFQREAKAAAALTHPNIITVHEIGEHENQAYIAMEYVEGGSLKDLLVNQELTTNKVIEIASQLCQGLSEAHQAAIVHRDIKPDNILLDSKGRVKIADFGLSKLRNVTKLTRESSTLGTLSYMSPEQIQSADVDQRSDIFSLGVVLYEMITGQLPFRGDYEAAVSYSILNEDPEPLARYKAGVSEGLQRIVDKTLDKDKETRYQHIDDLLSDLKRELKSSSGIMPVVTEKKLKPKQLILIAALTILAILATFVILNLLQEKPAPRLTTKHKQITFTGKAFYPAVSPDGQFIAYVTDENKLMMQDLSNAQTIELLQASAIMHPVWSPDGSEILVSANISENEGFMALIIPRLGGKPRNFGPSGYNCWVFDGSWIAVAYQDIKQIHLINKNTMEKKNIALSGFQWLIGLDWSREADQFLLLTMDKQKYGLWTIRSDGSGLRKLIEEDNLLISACWSNKGDAIYFFCNKGRTYELVKLFLNEKTEPESANQTILLSGLQVGDYFNLTGDGKQLVYTRALDYSNLWLYEFKQQTGNKKPVMKQLTQDFSLKDEPNISPDGKWISYSTQNVFKIPIEGGEPIQLTFSDKGSFRPVWSPDGRTIAYFSYEGGEPKLWTMNADGTNPRKYNVSLIGDFGITWAPGKKILYQRPGNQNFHLLDPETEEETPLVQNDSVGYIFSPEYSPDGKKIAVSWNRLEYGPILDPLDSDRRGPFARGLWVISLTDSSQTRVSDLYMLLPVGWSPDGKSIYAIHYQNNILMKIPTNGGEPIPLINLSRQTAEADVSPDGKNIVVSLQETKSDIWIMENFDPEIK